MPSAEELLLPLFRRVVLWLTCGGPWPVGPRNKYGGDQATVDRKHDILKGSVVKGSQIKEAKTERKKANNKEKTV